jgi:hypothetical protein
VVRRRLDPALADAEPELRANPSMASWASSDYLGQQRKRLPTHKYRRLHLNLPGAPDGAAFDGDKVMAAIVTGRRRLSREEGLEYVAFVDMSGGSSDDAVLGVSHYEAERKVAVLDALMAQTGAPPFNPRDAVRKFVAELKTWGITRVTGDAYAGQTFRTDFEAASISYTVSARSKSEIFNAFEPRLNAGEIELLDDGKLQEQLLTLVIRGGGKIDHQPGDHDDFANAACGALVLAAGDDEPAFLVWMRREVARLKEQEAASRLSKSPHRPTIASVNERRLARRNEGQRPTRAGCAFHLRPARHADAQAFVASTATVRSRHVGQSAGVVDEHQPLGVELELAFEPCLAPSQDVGPALLGRVRGLFYASWRGGRRSGGLCRRRPLSPFPQALGAVPRSPRPASPRVTLHAEMP